MCNFSLNYRFCLTSLLATPLPDADFLSKKIWLLWSLFVVSFFILPKLGLIFFIWSFCDSASFVSPIFILSIRFKALSYLLNFWSGVLRLYLYTKSSKLTFLSNSVISLSFSPTSLLNVTFCFEINGLSSSSSSL